MEIYKQSEEMSPEEKFEAIANSCNKIETEFIVLGQLLSEIKRSKQYKYKGYRTFKDFVQEEYNLSSSQAAKLIGVYDFFVNKLGIDEETLKSIGFDKLHIIKPLIKGKSQEETEFYIDDASARSITDLKEELTETRKKNRENKKTLKEVLVDQWRERMTTSFNCSLKELNYKLALYFQDANLDEVTKVIKKQQRKLDDNLGNKQETK